MSARIEDLEPVTQQMCRAWLAECEAAGLEVKVTHTLRTMDEQAHLYAKGRTLPGAIVTKAGPGQSPHNYGAAFDFAFRGPVPYPPESDPRWERCGRLGESLGLSWGGPLGAGDKFTFDRPHLERRDWRSLRTSESA